MDFLATLVSKLLRLALRLLFLVVGLAIAVGLLCLLLTFAGVWGLRALWAKLIGRPVTPWVMRVDPRTGWSQFAYRGQVPSAKSDNDGVQVQTRPVESAGRFHTVHKDDVVDVEIKELK